MRNGRFLGADFLNLLLLCYLWRSQRLGDSNPVLAWWAEGPKSLLQPGNLGKLGCGRPGVEGDGLVHPALALQRKAQVEVAAANGSPTCGARKRMTRTLFSKRRNLSAGAG